MSKKLQNPSSLLSLVAWLSLVLAFVAGQLGNQPDYPARLAKSFPGAQLVEQADTQGGPVVLEWVNRQPDQPQVVILGEGQGYGGPLQVAVTASRIEGGARVHGVHLIGHRETPPYVARLVKMQFFRQFAGASVTDDFLLDTDIDSFSGATVTARGVSQALRGSLHLGAVKHLGLEPSWTPDPWVFGWEEAGMLLLALGAVAVSVGGRSKPMSWLKTALPLVSLLFVGFYTNASISIGSLGSILLGYLPSIKQHPIWWILMGTIVLGVVVLGRNLYCNKLCPYAAVQSLLHKITGINMKAPRWLNKHGRSLVLGMIWASLMLIFLSRHPSMGAYEPFSMMFALEGTGLQWYILPLSLFGACFVPDFWCRYFCPVGLTINESVKLRRKWVNRLSQRRRAGHTIAVQTKE
ncbi:FMN-binding protein [Ferrimonas futtsuensis]|uniref:FMN-binding protein n=1 Tax=Ferrimonas futtsuensis TaxID=364764 RepID=UPI000407300B|nr:FMN-binding protein [Ferrimonas futtsuensis]